MTIDYGSVCSGIEAASVDGKPCTKCRKSKPLSGFHLSSKSSDGHASWCKPCVNTNRRENRKRTYSKANKAKWQLATRYRLSADGFEGMLISQLGRCAVCEAEMRRPCVDHCHNTGAVRGLVCHKCNIRLGGWDDLEWREKAIKYLGLKL